MKKYAVRANLKRIDEMKEAMEVSFLIDFDDPEQFYNMRTEIGELDDSLKLTFLDNKGII